MEPLEFSNVWVRQSLQYDKGIEFEYSVVYESSSNLRGISSQLETIGRFRRAMKKFVRSKINEKTLPLGCKQWVWR